MRSIMVILTLLFVPLIFAGDDLSDYIRKGDLDSLRKQIEAGLDIDKRYQYGFTLLSLAVQAEQLEITAYLLKKGADITIPDSFYHMHPLDHALGTGNNELSRLLLQHGAEPREQALSTALFNNNVALAKAVIEAGPINQSALDQLSQRTWSPELQALLKQAKSRPDPPPPNWNREQLQEFVGDFEGFNSDSVGAITLGQDGLYLAVDGADPVRLVPVNDLDFKAADSPMTLTFTGRAGMREGFLLRRSPNSPPDLLRHRVAQPLDSAIEKKDDIVIDVPETRIHWARFRGPNGSGIGDGPELVDTWDLQEKKNILWETPLEGMGHSSPVVWGDTIFLTTVFDTDAPARQTETYEGSDASILDKGVHSWRVHAYDKWTGRELWRKEIGKGEPETNRHIKATQANCTPASDGRYLVTVFPTAGMACLDMKGEKLWHHDMGGLNASAFYNPKTQWGFASSPIIHEDRVILQVDIFDEQYIAAWDLATGEQVWKTPRKVAPSWSTPVIWSTSQGQQLVTNASVIHGYDLETGKDIWSLGPNSELVVSMPVIGDGKVYVSAGYPPVKPIYAVKEGIRGHHEITPGQANDNLAWSHHRGGAYMPTPLLYRGWYHIIHYNGRLVTYDPDTGKAVHKARFSKRGTFTGSPIAVNGKIYLTTEEGTLYVVDAAPPFKELAAYDMGAPLLATPAVSEGLLLVRSAKSLIAIGKPPKKSGP